MLDDFYRLLNDAQCQDHRPQHWIIGRAVLNRLKLNWKPEWGYYMIDRQPEILGLPYEIDEQDPERLELTMENYGRSILTIPPEIVKRSFTNPIIHAALQQHLLGTDGIKTFLVKLVLLLADANDQSHAALLERVTNGPPPIVIIQKR